MTKNRRALRKANRALVPSEKRHLQKKAIREARHRLSQRLSK